ncbi:MAG: hypothetical protein QOK37_1831 [Thermoanaerobaculia bacterium]|jgi:hypothetical protein|nr:hypothetical protein [Thermoanaerobaculia bacterium]
MFSTRLLAAASVFCLASSLNAQLLVIPPYSINMMGSSPQSSPIPAATAGTHNLSNGAYDANGTLLFYIKDLNVYMGSNSQLKGHLPIPANSGGAMWTYEGAETEVVPIPGAEFCNRFYVVYTVGAPGGAFGYCLLYATIDWNNGAPTSNPPLGAVLSASSYPQNLLEWLYVDAQGLAVSKVVTVAGLPTRYLFTLGSGNTYQYSNNWGGVLRWTVDGTGIHNQIVIANALTDMSNYYRGPNYLGVNQMSISDDQTRLAWGGGTQYVGQPQAVFEIKLNTSYLYGGYFHQYSLPSTSSHSVAGVEYAAGSNKLYVSMWDGIFCIPSIGAMPSFLPNSQNVTHSTSSYLGGSQLQYMKSTSLIIGVGVASGTIGKLFSINPSNVITPNYSAVQLSSQTDLYWSAPAFALPDFVGTATTGCGILSPDFTYEARFMSQNNYFTISATPVTPHANCSPGFGDLWQIAEIDSSGNIIPSTDTTTGTTSNPQCWWIYPTANTFNGFDGTKGSGINNVTCSTPTPGRFLNGHTYRIKHGVWNSFCPWAEALHVVTVSGH